MAFWDPIVRFVRRIFRREERRAPPPPPPAAPARRPILPRERPVLIQREVPGRGLVTIDITADYETNLSRTDILLGVPEDYAQSVFESLQVYPFFEWTLRTAERRTGMSREELVQPGSPYWVIMVGLELEYIGGADSTWWRRGRGSWFEAWLQFLGLNDRQITNILTYGETDPVV